LDTFLNGLGIEENICLLPDIRSSGRSVMTYSEVPGCTFRSFFCGKHVYVLSQTPSPGVNKA